MQFDEDGGEEKMEEGLKRLSECRVCVGGGLDRADMNHSERFKRFHDTTGHRSRSFHKV